MIEIGFVVGSSRVDDGGQGGPSCPAHEITDALIKFPKDLVGFLAPILKLSKTTKHKILLSKNFQDLI